MKHVTSSTLFICICSCIFGAFLFSSAVHGATITKRAVAEGSRINSETEPKICHVSTPCGWAVYNPFTRRVEYFLRNTCRCPGTKKCIRTDDDLSVSAYVYRCRDGTSSTPSTDPERS